MIALAGFKVISSHMVTKMSLSAQPMSSELTPALVSTQCKHL